MCIAKRLVRILPSLLFVLSINQAKAATCTFTGNGDGTNWSDGDNWSCGDEPDPKYDDVIIPVGFNVINDEGNLKFENGHQLTIHGSLDMGDKQLEIKKTDCALVVSSTGTLTDVKKLKFKKGSTGTLNMDATVSVEELYTQDEAALTILARCIEVSDVLKNKHDAGIDGTGCINYGGTSGKFENSGTGGIFKSYSNVLAENPLDGSLTLPIELIRFQVSSQFNEVFLEWATASETDNDYFTIERSKDAQDWEVLEQIPGAGNSTMLIEYSFVDHNPLEGYSYYRLKQTDFNGEFAYSQIVPVEFKSNLAESEVLLYPNPVQTVLTIFSNESFSDDYMVFDLFGNSVTDRLKTVFRGYTTLDLDVSSLDNGYYLIKLDSEVIKFLKN